MTKPRKSSPKEAHELYAIAVTGWELSWNFTVAVSKWKPGPLSEYNTLTFNGDVVYPPAFKYPKAIIDIAGEVRAEESSQNELPKSIGFIEARDGEFRCYIRSPLERLPMLVTAAPRTRLLELNGTRLFRRSANVRGIRVDTRYNPDDWIE